MFRSIRSEPNRKEEGEERPVSPILRFVYSLRQIIDRLHYLAVGQINLATQQAEVLHRLTYFEGSQQLIDAVKLTPNADCNTSVVATRYAAAPDHITPRKPLKRAK